MVFLSLFLQLKKQFTNYCPLKSLSSFPFVLVRPLTNTQSHKQTTNQLYTNSYNQKHTHTHTPINSKLRVCLHMQIHNISPSCQLLSLALTLPHLSLLLQIPFSLSCLSSPLSARILINLLLLIPPSSPSPSFSPSQVFFIPTEAHIPHKFSLLEFFVLISQHDS